LLDLSSRKNVSKVFDSDLAFMRCVLAFRPDSPSPSAGGLVILPKDDVAGTLVFETLPDNEHLRVTTRLDTSIYCNEALLVHVDKNEFTVPKTSMDWLGGYYTWYSCCWFILCSIFSVMQKTVLKIYRTLPPRRKQVQRRRRRQPGRDPRRVPPQQGPREREHVGHARGRRH
tara:strand:- start:568 stop:1083 length:516 start_codon:yes stop_codon:yes gene_type:complete